MNSRRASVKRERKNEHSLVRGGQRQRRSKHIFKSASVTTTGASGCWVASASAALAVLAASTRETRVGPADAAAG